MSELAIKVEDVSKLYRLGKIGTGSIKSDLQRFWHTVRGKEDPFAKVGSVNDRTKKAETDWVWAVKDVSFEVNSGDVLGIIGRNGAGKSTLLKILSKITAPTTGQISINGRIASLLEVGTGFHPELSGRENIFLNGAILGMRKWEIEKKFDEIVDFAGVEAYIDTPVKRYSSGMYVRLAFAVAAFLEPEILIVDEVLAVGDAEFQKKCLGRMKSVSENYGRTVLFVSHNLASVKALCNKGVVMHNGGLIYTGTAADAVKLYQSSGENNDTFVHHGSIETAPGNDNIRIHSFKVLPLEGDHLTLSSGLEYKLGFYCNIPDINLDVTFELSTLDDVIVFHNGVLVTQNKDSEKGYYTISGKIDPYILNSGIYKFKLTFGKDQRYALFTTDHFIQFEIMNEMKGSNAKQLPGITFLPCTYSISKGLHE